MAKYVCPQCAINMQSVTGKYTMSTSNGDIQFDNIHRYYCPKCGIIVFDSKAIKKIDREMKKHK